ERRYGKSELPGHARHVDPLAARRGTCDLSPVGLAQRKSGDGKGLVHRWIQRNGGDHDSAPSRTARAAPPASTTLTPRLFSPRTNSAEAAPSVIKYCTLAMGQTCENV